MANIIILIKAKPGLVLYTMINKKLENYLKKKCREINVNAHPILDNTISVLKESFEIKTKNEKIPGKQHSLSDDYFKRIENDQYNKYNKELKTIRTIRNHIYLCVSINPSNCFY